MRRQLRLFRTYAGGLFFIGVLSLTAGAIAFPDRTIRVVLLFNLALIIVASLGHDVIGASVPFLHTRPGWRRFRSTCWAATFAAAAGSCALIAIAHVMDVDGTVWRFIRSLVRSELCEEDILRSWHWSLLPFTMLSAAALRFLIEKRFRYAAILGILATLTLSFPTERGSGPDAWLWERWSSTMWTIVVACAAVIWAAPWWKRLAEWAWRGFSWILLPITWFVNIPFADTTVFAALVSFVLLSCALAARFLGLAELPFLWHYAHIVLAFWATVLAFLSVLGRSDSLNPAYWLSRPSPAGGGTVGRQRRIQQSTYVRYLVVAAAVGIIPCLTAMPGLPAWTSLTGFVFSLGIASLAFVLTTGTELILPREGERTAVPLALFGPVFAVWAPAVWADVLNISSPIGLLLVVGAPLTAALLGWRVGMRVPPHASGRGLRAAWFLGLVAFGVGPLVWRERATCSDGLSVFYYSVLHGGRGLAALIVLTVSGLWLTSREARNGGRSRRTTIAAMLLSCVVPFAGALFLDLTRSRASWLSAPRQWEGLAAKLLLPVALAFLLCRLPLGASWSQTTEAKFIEDLQRGKATWLSFMRVREPLEDVALAQVEMSVEPLLRTAPSPAAAAAALRQRFGRNALRALTQYAQALVKSSRDGSIGASPQELRAGQSLRDRCVETMRIVALEAGVPISEPPRARELHALISPLPILGCAREDFVHAYTVLEARRAPESFFDALIRELKVAYIAGCSLRAPLDWVITLTDKEAIDPLSPVQREQLFALRWLIFDKLSVRTYGDTKVLRWHSLATIAQMRNLLDRMELSETIRRFLTTGYVSAAGRVRERVKLGLQLSVFDAKLRDDILAWPDASIMDLLEKHHSRLTAPQHAAFLADLTARLKEKWPDDPRVALWYADAHGAEPPRP